MLSLSQLTPKRTFYLLLTGVFFLLLTSLFIFTLYLAYRASVANTYNVSHRIVKAVRLAELLPPDKLSRRLRFIDNRGFTLSTHKSRPQSHLPLIKDTNSKTISTFVYKNWPDYSFSIKLKNNEILNIEANRYPRFIPIMIGFFLTACVIIISFIVLCRWAIEQVALPIERFTKAANQFSRDLQSPPLPVSGHPEMQEASLAFNQMQQRIRRLLNDRNQMLAAISHDLRTPITRLQLRAEYLKDIEPTQYDKANTDLKQMEQMISSILSFARDYNQNEQTTAIDLQALLDTIVNDFQDSHEEVTLEDQEHRRIPLNGRLNALKRVFTNLIENAIKYGKTAAIKIDEDDHNIIVSISDQGPGIAPSEREKVFNPFYRIDAARSQEISGSGLGLAVARDIIIAHGGEIQLKSRNDQNGLTVKVTLPKSQ